MARKSNVSQELGDKARELRGEGKTYQEIVTALSDKVTLDWCKRNLAGLAPEDNSRRIKDEIELLGLRPEGVTYKECLEVMRSFGMILPFHEDEESQGEVYKKYAELKKAVKRKNKDCLFRPAWISTEDAIGSWKAMERLAYEMNAVFNTYVDRYMEYVFPDDDVYASRLSVAHELAMLACDFKIVEGFTSRVDRNEKLARELEGRIINGKNN